MEYNINIKLIIIFRSFVLVKIEDYSVYDNFKIKYKKFRFLTLGRSRTNLNQTDLPSKTYFE